jgi:hypothetical protein
VGGPLKIKKKRRVQSEVLETEQPPENGSPEKQAAHD